MSIEVSSTTRPYARDREALGGEGGGDVETTIGTHTHRDCGNHHLQLERAIDVGKRLLPTVEVLDDHGHAQSSWIDREQHHVRAAGEDEVGGALDLVGERAVDEADSSSERPSVERSYGSPAANGNGLRRASFDYVLLSGGPS